VFSHPADLAVARIVGIETVVAARIVSQEDGLAHVEIHGRPLLAVTSQPLGPEAFVCIRGEDVVIQKGETGPMSTRNRLPGTVTSLVPEGPLVRVTLDCGFALTALVTRPACEELRLCPGDTVAALIKAPAIRLLPRS
jgi:molybdate transport system ATP-binding protein